MPGPPVTIGCAVVLTPGAGTDIDLAMARMREMVAAQPGRYFVPAEFENADNPQAQMASGEEIWEQTGGRLDAVVAAQGTGGWISGVARALKAHDPAIRAYAVEPAECPLISEQRWGTHGVPGIGDGIIPPNLDLAMMDGIVTASTAEALDMAARLAREEGLLCGPSSGINVVAALKVADSHPEFHRIVTVIADTGQRYLSGELFGERPDLVEVRKEAGGLQIEGYVAALGDQGPTRGSQNVFVNRRIVKDRTIAHAIIEAYSVATIKERSPEVHLFLRIAADRVDVNVHPTKAEVRFLEGSLVHEVLRRALGD